MGGEDRRGRRELVTCLPLSHKGELAFPIRFVRSQQFQHVNTPTAVRSLQDDLGIHADLFPYPDPFRERQGRARGASWNAESRLTYASA